MSIRLINTTTLALEVFVGSKVPKYAILSHTWVDNAEFTFHEMSSISNHRADDLLQKSGYRKIYSVCEVAKRNGFEYVWVDTCCIDKTSSAELSEAINSMFKWYQNAETCYAYLSDLPAGCDIEVTIRSCRYFTRGFTLQELLAPKTVQFYDETWNLAGTRESLTSTIQAITGIEQEILRRTRSLSEVPVAVRMSWASERVTTREEDIAYCLLGIFDVNMPLLYGEGQKAFFRLQEEIIKRSSDLSIFWNFASRTSLNASDNVSQLDGKSSDSSESEAEFVPGPYHRADDGENLGIQCHSYQFGRTRNLFASCPRDFSTCGQVTKIFAHADRATYNFALTNAGLHFPNAIFKIVRFKNKQTRSFYAMHLESCFPDPTDWTWDTRPCVMLLEKIAPELFVRCDISWSEYRNLDLRPTRSPKEVVENAYILLVDDYPSYLRVSNYCSVRLSVERGNGEADTNLERALQVLAPKAGWDAANEAFLLMSEALRGYVRLNPWDWRDDRNFQVETPRCYLAFRVYEDLSVNEQPVQLLLPKDLEQYTLQLAMGESIESILESYPESNCGCKAELVLDGVVVTAEINEVAEESGFGPICVNIQFKFEDRFKSRVEKDGKRRLSTTLRSILLG